jgi:murein DD-endopeptidase MepM/ murein hydrolase activator NlpD
MADRDPNVPALRRRGVRWGLGAGVVGIVTAALALPSWSPAESEPAPASATGADIFLTPDTEVIRGVVPRNTTLDALLRVHGLAAHAVERLVVAARSRFDPRRLRASQPFTLERTIDGDLRRFEYEIDGDTLLRVTHAPEHEVRADLAAIPKVREEVVAAGVIDASAPSLFQAMEGAGESAELSIALAGIFAGEIDFNTELQPGDRFGLAFEKFRREDGAATTYGDIAAAEFHNDGRIVRAIRFTPPGGQPGYFDEQGRSLRRFFLRSPLKFEPRITSRFSRRRLHPVLNTYRAHLGIDYGAPTGAPVVAVAAGTVVSATFDSANGRMVRLRHAGGYETYYLHLSAFGPGIRAGVRVAQGQLIGRVGATGLASGPHLDYRLRKNGVFVNPLAEHRRMPPGEPVPAEARADFEEVRDRVLDRLKTAMEYSN